MFNLSVILRESAARSPDQPVAIWPGGRLRYAELDDLSDRFAVALAARGVVAGQRVAVQLPNVAEFLVAYFGILKAGAVVVPLNVLLKTEEIAFHLAHSSARLLVTWGGVLEHTLAGAVQAGLTDVVVVAAPAGLPDVAAAGAPGPVPFADLLQEATDLHPMADTCADDTAVVVYTSGTTGRPKGAELTHFQLYMNSDIPGRLFGVTGDDVVIAALPLFHVFGLSSILDIAVRFGATLSLVPRFSAEAVLTAVQRDRATVFEGVPTMFSALLAYPDLDRCDVSSLRVAISGGAAIPSSVFDAFELRFGVTILEGYGLSETASTTTFNRGVDDRRPYSVGSPIWGTQSQIWDDEGRRLPAGREHVGEIVTRGFHTMKGYLDDPEATAAAFAGGWLHTGDLGYVDEDGYFFVVDRKKELIIRGGYNVYPREVEETLYRHPAVAEAAVIGVPDERLGEEVLAVVVLAAGADVSEDELVAYCREHLAGYKYPRRIDLRSQLPKGATGKILKLELKTQLAERPARSVPSAPSAPCAKES